MENSKTTKIFISHSSFDKDVAEALIDFLINGIGIDESLIFCSSVSGHDIPLGVNFNDYIIKQIKGYNARVIAIISNAYYNSKYCLYELGAAWGLCNGEIIPMLIHNMEYANLTDFIAFNLAIQAKNVSGLNKLASQLENELSSSIVRKVTHTRFETERAKFMKVVTDSKPTPEPKNKTPTDFPLYKYKAVVFDFDGTIMQGPDFRYSWKEVWQHLNLDDDVRREQRDRHYREPEKYSYQQWCDDCGSAFVKKGFHRRMVKEIIENKKLKLSDGFEVTIELLKNFGFKIAIISGGINTFVEELIPEDIRGMIDKIFVNKFVYDTDGYLERILPYQIKASDRYGKVKALESFCLETEILPNEVVFVGEGLNDIDVAGIAGLALSFPAQNAARDYNRKNYVELVHAENMASILTRILVADS